MSTRHHESRFAMCFAVSAPRAHGFVKLSPLHHHAGRKELDRLTQIGLSRFALFVADWDAEEVRTLGRLLEKLAVSKAAVGEREQRSAGRAWQKRRSEGQW